MANNYLHRFKSFVFFLSSHRKLMMARKVMKRRRAARTRRTSITQVLPLDCIAHILSLTSPRDVCAFSLVSSTFKSAADSDHVWDKFLPLDYQHIVSISPLLKNTQFSSKKHLFFTLFSPVLLDGGTKSLNLDKNGGKRCLMLGSKELIVNWGDDINWTDTIGRGIVWTGKVIDFWKWISPAQSRFAEAIELVNGDWLFISGKIDIRMLSPKTTYGAYIVFKFTDYACGFDVQDEDYEDACLYGLAESSVEFVRGEGSASGTHERDLNFECKLRPQVEYASYGYKGQFPSETEGGWLELELGEFYNDQGNDGEVELILKEKDDSYWKCGLWKEGVIVQGIELRPKVDSAKKRDLF